MSKEKPKGTWIKFYRKFEDWEWYKHQRNKTVFLHCLLRANYKDTGWRSITIKAGQFITSQVNFAKECGLSRQQIRAGFDDLVSTNDITIKATKDYTLVTVNNYKDYQQVSEQPPTNQPTNHPTNQPTSQPTTVKEVKKLRSKKTCGKLTAVTKKPTSKKVYHNGDIDQWFDVFWKVYPDRGPARNPKKASKDNFIRNVEKLGHDPKVIYLGAKVFSKTVADLTGEERRSIPMSSTWINGEEYTDFYDRLVKSAKPHSKEQFLKEGFMPLDLAEKYALDKFREPLKDCLTAFKIVDVENIKMYKPIGAK